MKINTSAVSNDLWLIKLIEIHQKIGIKKWLIGAEVSNFTEASKIHCRKSFFLDVFEIPTLRSKQCVFSVVDKILDNTYVFVAIME